MNHNFSNPSLKGQPLGIHVELGEHFQKPIIDNLYRLVTGLRVSQANTHGIPIKSVIHPLLGVSVSFFARVQQLI